MNHQFKILYKTRLKKQKKRRIDKLSVPKALGWLQSIPFNLNFFYRANAALKFSRYILTSTFFECTYFPTFVVMHLRLLLQTYIFVACFLATWLVCRESKLRKKTYEKIWRNSSFFCLRILKLQFGALKWPFFACF